VTEKTFTILRKISISNKCCSFELYLSKNPKKDVLQFPQKY